MHSIAYYATLFRHDEGAERAISGTALCTPDRRVFFRTEATGQWSELGDYDSPRLHLHGRCELVLEAAIADGDLVLKASRTLQRKAA